MADSTLARPGRKAAANEAPRVPKDFPLKVHKGRGYWCKKVRGKLHYFGKIADDPKGAAALAKWENDAPALLAGRVPRSKTEGLTVADLCDLFLNEKRPLVDSKELTQRMFDEYYATCERLTKAFGPTRLVEDLGPPDFSKLRASAAKKWGLHRLAGEIQRVRTIFKFGVEADHIKHVIKLGPGFKKPKKEAFQKAKDEKGPSLLTSTEIGAMLVTAGPQLRAMILLGINCGFGNADCGQLHFRALDLDGGWVTFPRGKTSVKRRCKLWPETVEALQAAIAERPTPKDPENEKLVFITKRKLSWFKITPDNPVSWEFRKLLNELNIHTHRKGFYWLRHTFETIGGAAKDQGAVDAVMGHADQTISAVYREKLPDDHRLEAVAAVVRGYIFPTVLP